MPRISLKQFFVGLLLTLVTHGVSANLLINPTRVQFNPSDRTVDITLINTSKVTTTYRMGWSEKKAKPGGGYDDLNDADITKFPTASNMLRFSPKQVTLKAGERQTIKIAIRRPQALATGEYRSHLLFKALPPKTAEEGLNPNRTAMSVSMVLSFSIPVVIQQGTPQFDMKINNASILYKPAQKDGSVKVELSRTGLHSTIGNISAYWTPIGGQERLIAKRGDYNFWPELHTTTADLTWVGADFAIADGKLRVVYEGVKDFRGKIFFDKTFSINRSSIKTLN